MNAALSFQRLLWKEVRALRQLWAMCGLGVTLLMLVVLAIGESSDHSRGYSAAFWVFMVWIPPVYVLAALSTMFAGEREEGTLVWLTAMAPKLATVLSSRLSFVVITGIGLQIWYGVAALLLSQFDDPVGTSPDDMQENFIIMTFILLEALAYGLFWSLQTNRPLNAILYAAFTLIMVNTGAVVLTEALNGRFTVIWNGPLMYALGFWGWARCLIVLAVMAANYELAGRWLNGRPCDWEWLARWWAKRRTVKVAKGSAVAVMPKDAHEPWRRTWQRLRWLEWQGIKSFFVIVAGLTVVSFGFLLVAGSPSTMGFSFGMGWLAVLIAGLLSWHGEQSQQRFRALVRLGASPMALWVNKFAAWFLASLVAMAVIVGTTAAGWVFLRTFYGTGRFPEWFGLWQHGSPLYTYQIVVLTLCFFVGIFALAFTCAHLFRKTVVAFGMSCLGVGFLIAWMVTCGQYALPWYLFYAPIPLWLLWISASTLPAWWMENTTWRLSRGRWVELTSQALFPAAVLVLSMGYRVWEVPSVPAVKPAEGNHGGLSLQAWPTSAAMQWDTVKKWQNLLTAIKQPMIIPSELKLPEDKQELHFRQPLYLIHYAQDKAAARRLLVQANQNVIDDVTSRVLDLHYLTTERAPEDNGGEWSALYFPITMYAAQQALEDGKTDESLRYLRAAVRLSGMMHRLRDPLQARIYPMGNFRQEMLIWAQHPQQTEATLRRGLVACAEELKYWQTSLEDLYLLRADDLQVASTPYWFWERARARKMADVAYSNRQEYLTLCRSSRLQPGWMSALLGIEAPYFQFRYMDRSKLEAWKFIPAEFRDYYYQSQQPIHGLEYQIIQYLFTNENRYRATLALMAVVGHRRLHGELPASMYEVQSCFEIPATTTTKATSLAHAMNDVWTGTPFGYVPSGFPLNEPEFPADSVFRQPLLWTAEARHHRVEIRNNQLERWTDAYGFLANDVIRDDIDKKSHYADWIIPIPAARPAELKE